MTRYPYADTVTLATRTRGTPDSDGNDTFTTGSTTLTGVPVWSRNASELVQGQDTDISGYWALLPTGTVVASIDKVTWNGDDYEIDGQPADLRSPFTGWSPGVLVVLTRVTG